MGTGGKGKVRREGKGREGRESDISKQVTLINTHFFQFLAIAA